MSIFGSPKVECVVCGKRIPQITPEKRDKRLDKSLSDLVKFPFLCRSCGGIVCFDCVATVTVLPDMGRKMKRVGRMHALDGLAAMEAEVIALEAMLVLVSEEATCPKCGNNAVGYCD